jgi:hypothetical protein
MKKIYTARNPIDAHLLKGALEGEQIEAIIQGDFLWAARGEVPITPETCPSVWIVNDADYEKAVQVLEDFKSQEITAPIQTEEWKCDNCNETNEGQFLECWQCGTLRKKSL